MTIFVKCLKISKFLSSNVLTKPLMRSVDGVKRVQRKKAILATKGVSALFGKLVYKLYHHQKNSVLVAENLNISNMVQSKHLSKSISDASWGKFFEWCGNIAERDGFHFHQVDPKNTSQICSSCGQKSPKNLSLAIRTFKCSFCGMVLDRDHNAALNILLRAAAALRGERWVTTLYEARNKNEARDKGLQNATQLTLFDATAGFPSL